MRSFFLVLLLLLGQGFLAPAQDVSDSATPSLGSTSDSETGNDGVPTVEELKERRAAVAEDADIADAVKPLVDKMYERAIAFAENAEGFREREKRYWSALKEAPAKTRESFDALEKPLPPRPLPPADLAAVDDALATAVAAFAQKTEELEAIRSQITESEGMPALSGKRLPEAREELGDVEQKLAVFGPKAGAPTAGRAADETLLRSQRASLMAEISMLETEQLGHNARVAGLDAQEDVLERELKELQTWIATLERQRAVLLESDSRSAVEDAEKLVQEAASGTPEAQALAAGTLELAKEYERISAQAAGVLERQRKAKHQLKRERVALENIREQFEIGGLQGRFVTLLQRRRDRSVDPSAYRSLIELRRESLGEARLGDLAVREQLENLKLGEESPTDDLDGTMDRFAETRRALLEKLEDRYRDLIRGLVGLVAVEQSILEASEATKAFLREELFWVQSSPPISSSTFELLPESWQWFFARDHWTELVAAVAEIPLLHPSLTLLVGLILVCLLLFWKRVDRAIVECGRQTRRISTDQYRHTGRALFLTLLMSLPIPLALDLLSGALLGNPDASNWLRGFATGIGPAFGTYVLFFLAIACREGGLCDAHFGWDHMVNVRVRRAAWTLLAIYIPGDAIIATTYFEQAIYFESLGRILYIGCELVLAGVLFRALRPSDGIFSAILRSHPKGATARLRGVWFPLAVGGPLFLVAMASLGYVLTAMMLSVTFRTSVGLVATGFVVYALILRWFLIRERKLALSEAIELRRQRRVEVVEEPESAGSDQFDVEAEEKVLDVASIGEQTRRLLRVVLVISVLVGLYYLWTVKLSALQVVNNIVLFGTLNLGDFLRTVLAGIVTFAVARNLPGLLEVAILRPLEIAPGTRKAVSTLCQYAVVMIGLAIGFHFLHVDWSKFGWIAAALSVGLGFGLQEVVANFICGIIILFERPIRIGDTVTVQDIEGVVTQIQMRATTITNWERKDFIVPNKELVTGTLMNWTLTTPITRVTIPVGVAYGTDTARAREILLEIAKAHPDVLEDPPPFTAFADFADSALALELRVYLGDINRRIGTYSALRQTIAERFAEAGIEIAFPQRDLHIRSVPREAADVLAGLARGGNASADS